MAIENVPPLPPLTSTRDAALAMSAGFMGWTLDAFDFFLVVMAVPTLAKDFGVSRTDVTFSLTLTLMFRPLGALIFGLLADRFGRRWPMMINLVFYSGMQAATAFTHSWTTFLILRSLFGIGMGGEWGVGASLVMEKVPARLRGLLSGLLQEGYAFGLLLAALAAHFLLVPYGWRPMFLLGGLPAILAIFIRFGVSESEVWEKNKADSWSQLGGALKKHWKLWIYLTLLMAMMNLSSHGTQDSYPTFLKVHRGVSEGDYTNITMIAALGAIIGGVLAGFASDRLGRRRVMAIAFVGAMIAIPMWAFSSTLAGFAVGAFSMQFMVQGAWGVIPAHINELSPNNVRGFLPGFSYQCGNLIAASIAEQQSSLAEHYDYAKVLAITVVIIFALAIVVTLSGPEKRGVHFLE